MTELNLKKLVLLDDAHHFGDLCWEATSLFSENAVLGNHEISRFDLYDKKVGPCKNCQACYSKEVACAYLDDFNALAPELLSASELVVIASGDFSERLNNVLSKFCCFANAPTALNLEKVLLLYFGDEATEKANLEGWVFALMNLAPEKAHALRFDALDAAAQAKIKELAFSF